MKSYLSSSLTVLMLLGAAAVRSDDVPSINSLSSIGEGRLLVEPKTITTTTTITQTATATETATTSCATVAAGLSACRKRRNVIEEPIMINQDVIQAPADSHSIEVSDVRPEMARQIVFASAMPSEDELCDARSFDSADEQNDSVNSKEAPAITSSIDTADESNQYELHIQNLQSICNARDNAYIPNNLASLLGLTLVSSVVRTNTATTTTTVTTTTTNKFTILGCTPSPFPYDTC